MYTNHTAKTHTAAKKRKAAGADWPVKLRNDREMMLLITRLEPVASIMPRARTEVGRISAANRALMGPAPMLEQAPKGGAHAGVVVSVR